ncbi:uncharacterized protein PRCAT00002568001 [Priceomyces carsonii]|uniref:uncharacterized protein n=1 Tax=Priceomyces carsonii TaxID=28549 RepID=UPI002ED8D64F|nr:unnamed protein product [Priceomyces carsonii]
MELYWVNERVAPITKQPSLDFLESLSQETCFDINIIKNVTEYESPEELNERVKEVYYDIRITSEGKYDMLDELSRHINEGLQRVNKILGLNSKGERMNDNEIADVLAGLNEIADSFSKLKIKPETDEDNDIDDDALSIPDGLGGPKNIRDFYNKRGVEFAFKQYHDLLFNSNASWPEIKRAKTFYFRVANNYFKILFEYSAEYKDIRDVMLRLANNLRNINRHLRIIPNGLYEGI